MIVHNTLVRVQSGALHQPPNHRLGGRFRGLRMTVTVVSTSSGSRTSSSTTTSTEVVFGMCVVEDELMMFGVGEATRRVFDGCWTVTGVWTVWCCVCVTVLVSVANSMAVSVKTMAGALIACKRANDGQRTVLADHGGDVG